MSDKRTTARQTGSSEFLVDAQFTAFSRYDYDDRRVDAFVDGVRWTLEHRLDKHERALISKAIEAGADPQTVMDVLRRVRLDPEDDAD